MAFSAQGTSGPLADINVTPLVDVMLVLLIIFIVTAPLVSVPIPVNLPQRTDQFPPGTPPSPIDLHVDASNQITWNGQPITVVALQSRMRGVALDTAGNQPLVRIDTDADAEYDVLAKVLAAASNAHLERITIVK